MTHFLKSGAAGLAALFLSVTETQAEPVRVSGPNGLALEGEVIGFDGDYLRLITAMGEFTLDYGRVTCEGGDCPDPAIDAPRTRFSGSGRIGDLLLPALIEGFARDQRLRSTRSERDDGTVVYVLRDGDAALGEFWLSSTTTDAGFDDLLSYQADVVLSAREAREDEMQIARDIGLGRLNDAKSTRILALDAIVPITSVTQPVREIATDDLARAFAGDVTRWAELGGADVAIVLHLPDSQLGLAQGFEHRVLELNDLSVSADVDRHVDVAALINDVSRDVRALGIAHYADVGAAVPMSLVGHCGLRSNPNRANVMTGDYPLVQPLLLYVPERRLPAVSARFLAWLRSAEAQLVIRRAGFVDQGHMPIPNAQQGDRFLTAIRNAGDEISLEELQRLAGFMQTRVRLATTFRFEAGSTDLTLLSRSNVAHLARAIRDGEYNGRELVLVGFSDGSGAASANQRLSAQRAERVRREITEILGPDLPLNVRLETEAFGEALPIGCDDTIWGQQMNRRVELWVTTD